MSGSPPGSSVFADVGNGMRLHARVAGAGPPLLLLHGFTGSSLTWNELAERLSPRMTTIAVDLPGHGLSSAPRDVWHFRLDRLADSLVRLLRSLNIGKTAVLGYSMGGRAALQLALRHGSSVSALVLESASPGIANIAEREARRRADADLAEFIEREGVKAFVERWEALPLWSSQESLPDARRMQLRAQRLCNQAAGLANSLRGAGAGELPSLAGELSSLRMNTLLIAGELDPRYVEFAQEMQNAVAHAELRVLPEAGHAAHLERFDAYAETVEEFLVR